MKNTKVLLGLLLVFLFASCDTGTKQVIAKDELFDKVKGAWAGQILGVPMVALQNLDIVVP